MKAGVKINSIFLVFVIFLCVACLPAWGFDGMDTIDQIRKLAEGGNAEAQSKLGVFYVLA